MPTSKRTLGTAAVLALSVASACLVTSSALADPQDPMPSKQDVSQAQQAVTSKRDEVRQIRDRLAAANTRLQQTSDKAEIAAEAYNGARWAADQARKAADAARTAAQQASDAEAAQRKAYAQGVVGNYQTAPQLTALAGIAQADGIDQIQQQTQAMAASQKALNAQYGRMQASAALATVTSSHCAIRSNSATRDANRKWLWPAPGSTSRRTSGLAVKARGASSGRPAMSCSPSISSTGTSSCAASGATLPGTIDRKAGTGSRESVAALSAATPRASAPVLP